MGLFRRVNDILSANLNDLVDRFEDPEKMLKAAIREMDDSIADATAAAAKAIASERLAAKELAEHERQVAHWQSRAETAVTAGEDELARRALGRKREHEKLAQALRDQTAAAEQATRTLRRQIEAMRAKHAQARRMLASLVARNKAAEARIKLQHLAPDLRLRSDAFSKFDRMRERVELAEAEADAVTEFGGVAADEFAPGAADDDDGVEAELVALREKLGCAAAQPAGAVS